MGKKPFGKSIVAEGVAPDYSAPASKSVRFADGLEVTDFVWMGDDGEQKLLGVGGELTSKQAALTKIVTKIVDAHPDKSNRERRIEDIVALLLGTEKRARGRRKSDEYRPLLLDMAEKFLLGFYNQQPQAESLHALALAALQASENHRGLAPEEIGSKLKTLTKRFRGEKDELLDYVAAVGDEEVKHQNAIVARIVDDLQKLRIV